MPVACNAALGEYQELDVPLLRLIDEHGYFVQIGALVGWYGLKLNGGGSQIMHAGIAGILAV
jgi:hypothetical protein